MPEVPAKSDDQIICQLEVEIEGLDPVIWRRVLVPESCVLDDLHSIIQGIFLWEDDHMWVFRTPAGNIPPMDFEEPEAVPPKALDPAHVTLENVFSGKTKSIEYEYDFGDSWIHKITLEKRLPPEPGVKYPVVIAGEYAGPLEDSGGVYGYSELAIIKLEGPRNAEEREMLQWAGGRKFNPLRFDLKECNKRLGRFLPGLVLIPAAKKAGAAKKAKAKDPDAETGTAPKPKAAKKAAPRKTTK